MIGELDRLLQQWAVDESIEAVVITGAGDRAFCAGGDVKSICAAARQGQCERDRTFPAEFFRAEYRLNHRVSVFPKPYVAYLDGITMGGGAGISLMGSHRIASEFTTFAMPETAIGFYPDVGGSYFLSRLGPIGTLLALTGMRLDAAAMLELGLATHYVPRTAGAGLAERIAADGVDAAIEVLAEPSPPSETIEGLTKLAQRCFDHPRVEEIEASLVQVVGEDVSISALAQQLLEMLRKQSPTSVKVTLEQLRRGRSLTFAECLQMEYRLSQAFMMGRDFCEGVRALLVDKDQSPRWQPDSFDQVDSAMVSRYFDEVGDGELLLEQGD